VAVQPIRLQDLAAALGRELEGDPDVEIRGVASLEGAGPGDLSFARSERFARQLAATRAGAVILPPGLETHGVPAIRSPLPGLDFARAVRRLLPERQPPPGIHPSSRLAEDARVDPLGSVGPGCWVGSGSSVGPRSVLHAGVVIYDEVTVGADCVLHGGCVLREGTRLGDRVVLQPGVVLGGDGFGFATSEEGRREKVPQVGRVVVEDDVEIGANTTVDRGTLGDTRIGRGAKLDNLVHVGHNCRVGAEAVIVAQSGLAGSASLGRGTLVMGQAGIIDHVRVGEGAFIGPRAGVHRDVPAGARVMGAPHRDMRAFQRIWASLAHLPDLLRRVRAVERRLGLRGGKTLSNRD
jgi:UDP-3-O-[3-hydroxymyristoyl] glucosamine N-acyltransferase